MSEAATHSRSIRAHLAQAASAAPASAKRLDTVCAWCDDSTRPALRSARPLSHGICPPCLDAQLAVARSRPRPGLARSAFRA